MKNHRMTEADPEKKLIRGEDYEYPRMEKIKELSPKQKKILSIIAIFIIIIATFSIWYVLTTPEWNIPPFKLCEYPNINNYTDSLTAEYYIKNKNQSLGDCWKIRLFGKDNGIKYIFLARMINYIYSSNLPDMLFGDIFFHIQYDNDNYAIKWIKFSIIKFTYLNGSPSSFRCVVDNDIEGIKGKNIKVRITARESSGYPLITHNYPIIFAPISTDNNSCAAQIPLILYINGTPLLLEGRKIVLKFEITYGKNFFGIWYDEHTIADTFLITFLPMEVMKK